MNFNVMRAIFKRNFVSYFSNPTGYVFICVFVLLSSAAAFWPNDFFNNNLANLDQLSKYLPYIMLVFVPAITMSIWSEERRLGTDELLLTIPAGDFDVVLGKYLAAVAIFSVSLSFSLVANFIVLALLGNPDLGLYLGAYLGYWFVGLTMLAVGMVASFLTSNLTVGFVLGALFNAPLAFSAQAEVILPDWLARFVAQWSAGQQFQNFERGVVSISSMSYFILLTAVMIYLSIVLIGRRHWRGGKDGDSLIGHFFIRTISLVVIACGVSYVFANHDILRVDVTSERLSSLSPDTRRLIEELETEHPIRIEAYISPRMPTEYVKTRLDLISALTELASLGGGKIIVEQHTVENFSDAAADARTRYGIEPQSVLTQVRGAAQQTEIIMGVALTSGLEKQVLPFIDKGIPVEYELARSIATVAQQKKKRVGVIKTDVQLFGGADLATMQMTSDQLLIEELRKQYDVVEVDATAPIIDDYDALLVVQPSTLPPESLDNLIHAIQAGRPTAIFEDPLPGMIPVPGTSQPRRAAQMDMFMGGSSSAPPKGDITRLWKVLGVDIISDQIISQDYMPYKQVAAMATPEWVFVDKGAFREDSPVEPFNPDDPISAGLQQVLFPLPGSIRRLSGSKLEFIPLATTGDNTSTARYSDLIELLGGQRRSDVGVRSRTGDNYVISARIQSDPQNDSSDEKSSESSLDQSLDTLLEDPTSELATDSNIHVVLVADVDCLASDFFALRARGQQGAGQVDFQFDNVTFVLNALDSLAGDDRFISIRSRRRTHRTLTKVEESTDAARKDAEASRAEFIDMYNQANLEEQMKFEERLSEIQKQEGLSASEIATKIEIARSEGQQRVATRQAQIQIELDKELEAIDNKLELQIRDVQNGYKLAAVLIPPLPPLLLAAFVFFHRRNTEREGVDKNRLK